MLERLMIFRTADRIRVVECSGEAMTPVVEEECGQLELDLEEDRNLYGLPAAPKEFGLWIIECGSFAVDEHEFITFSNGFPWRRPNDEEMNAIVSGRRPWSVNGLPLRREAG